MYANDEKERLASPVRRSHHRNSIGEIDVPVVERCHCAELNRHEPVCLAWGCRWLFSALDAMAVRWLGGPSEFEGVISFSQSKISSCRLSPIDGLCIAIGEDSKGMAFLMS